MLTFAFALLRLFTPEYLQHVLAIINEEVFYVDFDQRTFEKRGELLCNSLANIEKTPAVSLHTKGPLAMFVV